MQRTKLLTLIAFLMLSGVIIYSRAHLVPARQHQEPLKTGFTVTYTTKRNGQPIATSVRYVRSNGEFLDDTNYLNPDGSSQSHEKVAGTLARGTVAIDDARQRLEYLGLATLIRSRTEAEFRESEDFNRQDSFLGYRVIVWRRCDPPNQCSEFWFAPDFGGEPLKTDIPCAGGRQTKEATNIKLGEPTFVVPDYPVDKTRFEQLTSPIASP